MFNAYILAADPTWLARSVTSYQGLINTLYVSYDRDGLGWTGSRIPVQRCLSLARDLPTTCAVQELPGRFSLWPEEPLQSETRQRQSALDEASRDADWVLQLDTDELLPDSDLLLPAVAAAEASGCSAIEWPMKVLFRRTLTGQYLEVANHDGSAHYEYPGPIVARAGSRLDLARHVPGPVLRVVVHGDERSARSAPGPIHWIAEGGAIWHNSWARSPVAVWGKVRSWGHNDTGAIYRYYFTQWLLAPLRWRSMRDFHPFSWGRWERLRPVSIISPPRQCDLTRDTQ